VSKKQNLREKNENNKALIFNFSVPAQENKQTPNKKDKRKRKKESGAATRTSVW